MKTLCNYYGFFSEAQVRWERGGKRVIFNSFLLTTLDYRMNDQSPLTSFRYLVLLGLWGFLLLTNIPTGINEILLCIIIIKTTGVLVFLLQIVSIITLSVFALRVRSRFFNRENLDFRHNAHSPLFIKCKCDKKLKDESIVLKND